MDAEPGLIRIAERLCANAADARDLVQETFARVIAQGLPPHVRNPNAWLATTMHNRFIDYCRRLKTRPNHESLLDNHPGVSPLEPDPPEPAWASITIEDIRAVLPELDATYREVYELHTFEGLSYEQIAVRLGIQRITVGTRLNRARKKLRELLVKQFGLEDEP